MCVHIYIYVVHSSFSLYYHVPFVLCCKIFRWYSPMCILVFHQIFLWSELWLCYLCVYYKFAWLGRGICQFSVSYVDVVVICWPTDAWCLVFHVKGDCKSSMHLMMGAIGWNMQYMQTHGVFTPELYWLINNRHCLIRNMRLQYNISNDKF
jgi:hypothetical protein